MILCRLAYEAIINLLHLIHNGSSELFQSYVLYSFQHEKKLFNRINKNISERGGEVLDIEKRMLDSIRMAAQESNVTIEDVSDRGSKNWGDKNLFEKAKSVGLDEAYLAFFGGGSHSVHGNWRDLQEYHLEYEGGFFLPYGRWAEPRPQILLSIAKLATIATKEYLNFIGHLEARRLFHERLDDLELRIWEIDDAHEKFLQNRE